MCTFKGGQIMSLVLECEAPPFREDESGAIRIGNTRVLLKLVIRAFQDGASPEPIVQRYSTLSLSGAMPSTLKENGSICLTRTLMLSTIIFMQMNSWFGVKEQP
jgi:hypothetical protein